jgi:hypothetical protein
MDGNRAAGSNCPTRATRPLLLSFGPAKNEPILGSEGQTATCFPLRIPT